MVPGVGLVAPIILGSTSLWLSLSFIYGVKKAATPAILSTLRQEERGYPVTPVPEIPSYSPTSVSLGRTVSHGCSSLQSELGKSVFSSSCPKKKQDGTSLAVQWLGLGASTAGGPGSIPGQGTKIPQAARRGQKNKQKQRRNRKGRRGLGNGTGLATNRKWQT